jgi:hypothetical protein
MTVQSIQVKLMRPTQIAVGQRLVKIKRKELRNFERRPQELVDMILAHPIRVVIGPLSEAYIIDHHHLGCALLKEGFKSAPVQMEADLSALSAKNFWAEMQKRQWVHPFDGAGRQRALADIPSSLSEMQDDPYRSLAGCVRMAGGFEKTAAPYVEFLWADYFRPLVKSKRLRADFSKAVQECIPLAQASEAAHLPGYLGKKVTLPPVSKPV